MLPPFKEEALLSDQEGRYHLLPITTKERLHHYEPHFSASPKLSDKDRNSWHLGVDTRGILELLPRCLGFRCCSACAACQDHVRMERMTS